MLVKKGILPVKNKPINADPNFLRDIHDANYYQKFRIDVESSGINFENVYSFCFNTDGISLADKSNLSIWPFFININEINLNERYHIGNTIICGILNYNNLLI